MTLRGRLIPLFPLVHLGLSAWGPVRAIQLGEPLWLLWAPVFVYLFPPLCYRLHQVIWPVREGRSSLSQPVYSPWWTSLHLQAVFNALPCLEALLRLFPGAYSAWLRLWGSRVGRGVVWTPQIEISDRAQLEIGDQVVFGHRVALYAHIVDRRNRGESILYLKRIRIGNRVFVGAGSRFGPGASVPDDVRVPKLTDISLNERFEQP